MSLVYSQNNIGTTETEYNYVSKGYKIQLESGLDMKTGYRFEDKGSFGVEYSSYSRMVSYKFLFKDGAEKPCAILMILNRTDTDFESHLCIPTLNSSEEILKKSREDYFSAVNDWSSSSKAYSWGMIQMISKLACE